MKLDLDDEIIEQFTLLPPEIEFLGSNNAHNHLGKALLLKFFQAEGRFPESENDFSPVIIEYVSQQLNLPSEVIKAYNWQGRSSSVHRGQIRELLGFHPATLADQDALRTWLRQEVMPQEYRPSYLEQLCYQRLRQLHIEAPSKAQMERLVKSALHQYEQAFFDQTATQLSDTAKENLSQLIYRKSDLAQETALEEDEGQGYVLHDLKAGPGEARVRNIKKVADRLKTLQAVGLPKDLFQKIPLRFLRQYQQQVAVESISHLQRRNKNAQTYSLLAAFCWVRQREITDQFVDLVIRLLNDINLRAKQRVKREILLDFIRVEGKQQVLYRLAEAILANPDGVIRDILYPIVSEAQLRSLVQEAKSKGVYQKSVQTQISASYTHHYRRMLPPLLAVLTFRSNNDQYQPLIDALAIVAAYLEDKDAFYPLDEEIPLEGVVQKQWQSWIYQTDKAGQRRIRRVRYELCVLQALRDKLRCKEIWVEGADRYRNPDEDVPANFGTNRKAYYEALTLPLEADDFVQQVKDEMAQALQTFNDTLPKSSAVEILAKSGSWIRLSPLSKQEETLNLRYLKYEIRQRWWMTKLLDIIKEVDFQVDFTHCFQSLTGQERLPQAERQKRLLLCLFGLGTNTGLTSVSMGNHGVSYANSSISVGDLWRKRLSEKRSDRLLRPR